MSQTILTAPRISVCAMTTLHNDEKVVVTAASFPVAVVKDILRLTPYLETANDPVQYHTARSELTGLLDALSIYRKLVYDLVWETPVIETVVLFCIRHHWNGKSKEELAEQLLDVLRFYPND